MMAASRRGSRRGSRSPHADASSEGPWGQAATHPLAARYPAVTRTDLPMNNIVYIVGAVVIVIAILSFLGLR